MIDKIFRPARALMFSLAMTVALAAGSLGVASVAMAQGVSQTPSISTAKDPSGKFNFVLAQDKATKKKPDADPDAQRDELRNYLKDLGKSIREMPLVKRFFSILPVLWTPIRVAFMLLFAAFYIVFHFKRQRRQQLEADLNAQPSAAEIEFGIDSKEREVSP